MKGGIDFIPYLDIQGLGNNDDLGKGNESFLFHQRKDGLWMDYDAL